MHPQHPWHSNSSLQYETHGGKTENFALPSFLSHELHSMSPNERHSPSVCAGTTCSAAHTNLASIDQRFRNHSPPTSERLKSLAKSLYLQDRSSQPIPTSHISYPFPRPNYSPGQQRVTCSLAQRWVQQVPHHLGAQPECTCIYERAVDAGCRGPRVQGSPCWQCPRAPRGRSAISSFACTSHMTPSCFQACRWQSIYFSNPALWQGNFIVWCFCQEN